MFIGTALHWAWVCVVLYAELFLATWVLYVFTMAVKQADKRGALPTPVRWLALFVIFVFAGPADLLLNLLSSVPLGELPRYGDQEYFLTARLKRLKDGRGWRSTAAWWICGCLLNPFVRKPHC